MDVFEQLSYLHGDDPSACCEDVVSAISHLATPEIEATLQEIADEFGGETEARKRREISRIRHRVDRVLVALNDGTDEIYNLHAFRLDSKAGLYMDWGDTFITAVWIHGEVGINESLDFEFMAFSEIVDYDADWRCTFLIRKEPMEKVLSMISGGEFTKEDFTLSWKEVLAKMGWGKDGF